ncbi:cytochrome c oxidase polypeptide V [Pestalotiopsis sp. NC0098]|nr:cytochrome c oxidase polypeptide V [Pestalotiopsis sp. NC0098]
MMRTSLLRATRAAAPSARLAMVPRAAASTHAISKPTLANIEKRWEDLPSTEQAELWMALRDRMKENWAELTVSEKKAAYWIAFGPHGPRAQAPADEGRKVALYVAIGVGVSLAVFSTMRMFAKPPPPTMTKEYQEASNEFVKAQRAEPLTGISSPGYEGKGMVQSAPKH